MTAVSTRDDGAVIRDALPSGLALRRAIAADDAFLREVFATTRHDELAMLRLDDTIAGAFLAEQYDAQRVSFLGEHPDAEQFVVLVDDVPSGRLWIDDTSPTDRHLLDVSLLPHMRRSGLGEVLLLWVIRGAAANARTVTLQVARSNPARRLYERLGFNIVGGDDVHLALRWDPAPVS